MINTGDLTPAVGGMTAVTAVQYRHMRVRLDGRAHACAAGMTGRTAVWRPFEGSAQMAALAIRACMYAGQRKTGRKVIEISITGRCRCCHRHEQQERIQPEVGECPA